MCPCLDIESSLTVVPHRDDAGPTSELAEQQQDGQDNDHQAQSAAAVCELDTATQLAPQNNQLMPKAPRS